MLVLRKDNNAMMHQSSHSSHRRLVSLNSRVNEAQKVDVLNLILMTIDLIPKMKCDLMLV